MQLKRLSLETKDGEAGEVEKRCLNLQFRSQWHPSVSDIVFQHISS